MTGEITVPQERDAQVTFTPAQLAALERVFMSQTIRPGILHDQIMYDAGSQAVLTFVRNHCSGLPQRGFPHG